MKLSLALALSFSASAIAAVPSLTPENYDELTAGKTIFVKFFAPWCGHCKSMAPDWEKLADEFEGSTTALIAEVDCTEDENQPLCEANGVKGFPTLKHGDPSALEDYEGGRTYDDFASFAKDNLVPKCSPSNIGLCDEDKKAEIEALMAIPTDELDSKIAEKDAESKAAEDEFQAEVEKLQQHYESLMADKDAKQKAVKDSGLGLMKAVKAAKAKTSSGSEEL
eukprot:CAMPEP_0194353394 /NCGR_PEP_ID=MMETSP0174-20130528/1708_1 /TAXON_ID=216777 /ORGANISM="Proboscia alata, Strain PI-D3" /LENGTH=222 /DNA_ID=CAMNT_0039121911 /DNA_START=88 /DNA_END=756 /DNA_ORIENTATION=+